MVLALAAKLLDRFVGIRAGAGLAAITISAWSSAQETSPFATNPELFSYDGRLMFSDSLEIATRAWEGALASTPVAVFLIFIAKAFIDGAAARHDARKPSVRTPQWSTAINDGCRWWWAMMRVQIAALILFSVGAVVIWFAVSWCYRVIAPRETILQLHAYGPLAAGGAVALWGWIVGAIALHLKAMLAASRTRKVFSMVLPTLRLVLRWPLRAVTPYVALHVLISVLWIGLIVHFVVNRAVVSPAPFFIIAVCGVFLQAGAWRFCLRRAVKEALAVRGRADEGGFSHAAMDQPDGGLASATSVAHPASRSVAAE